MFKRTEKPLMLLCAFFQKLLKKSQKTLDSPYVVAMDEIHYTQVKNWAWPNFTPKEIACKGTEMIIVDRPSMDALQRLRTLIYNKTGAGLIINSGYRSESHNKAVGGSPNSQHRLGKAFDIRITSKVSRETIKQFAYGAGFNGIGDYDNFIHVDTGPKRNWDNRK